MATSSDISDRNIGGTISATISGVITGVVQGPGWTEVNVTTNDDATVQIRFSASAPIPVELTEGTPTVIPGPPGEGQPPTPGIPQ